MGKKIYSAEDCSTKQSRMAFCPPTPSPPRLPFCCIVHSAADKMAICCLICFLRMSFSTLSMACLAFICMGGILARECGIGLDPGCRGCRAVDHNDNYVAIPSGADLGLWRRPWLAIVVIVAGWIWDNDGFSRIWKVDGTHPPQGRGERVRITNPLPIFLTTFFVGTAQRCHPCRRSKQGWGQP
jgi:hypothetical protein